MPSYFWIHKKVHWSDTDAAGIVWFPNFLGWFEDAEEELFAALGRPRQALLDAARFGMPRVDVHTTFHSPVRAGDLVRVGISSRIENPRRIRHEFEIRRDDSQALVTSGFVRVASIELATFTPRDLPEEVVALFAGFPALVDGQQRGDIGIPWT